MDWSAEFVAYLAYWAAGPVVWGLTTVALVKGSKRMALFDRPCSAPAVDLPTVSVLVPAKDEAERVAACLKSILGQAYPNLEVVAVDDRSTDTTAAVIADLAATDARLLLLRVRPGELPPGWTGKNHALSLAADVARGRLLLMVDCDVVLLRPDTLRRAVEFALAKRVALLSLLPRLDCRTNGERVAVPLAGMAVSLMHLVALTNNDHRRTAFANGQFLLIDRAAYDAAGGHAAVRASYCEDVELARRVKASGARVRLAWGTSLAAVRMYAGLGDAVKGWARIFYGASSGRPGRIVAAGAFMLACVASAYIAAGWGLTRIATGTPAQGLGWLAAAGVHLVLMTSAVATTYRWTGNPRRTALLLPVGVVAVSAALFRALWTCVTGRVEWRGTLYAPTPATTHSPDPPDPIATPSGAAQ